MAFRAIPLFCLPTAAALLATLGCGPVTYSVEVARVERVVSEARAENASYYSPYELYYAEAQLDKAHEEAAEGQYENAINALNRALAYGRRALTRSAQPDSLNR